jgi:hypothetical protein
MSMMSIRGDLAINGDRGQRLPGASADAREGVLVLNAVRIEPSPGG